jgi:hypothetical protein
MKITIENLNGRLRLRWICPVSGKRKTLAVGMADSAAMEDTTSWESVLARLKTIQNHPKTATVSSGMGDTSGDGLR